MNRMRKATSLLLTLVCVVVIWPAAWAKLLTFPGWAAGALVTLIPNTNGNLTPDFYLPTGAANQDQHQVKATAGQVYSYHFSSTATYVTYAKLYDVASGGCTSANTPKWVAIIPANTNGSGNNFNESQGIAFASGICVRFTQGQANADTTAVTSGFITSSIAFY